MSELSVQSVCQLQAAATQNRGLQSFFRNDRIASSVNPCDKLFHSDNKAVFSWPVGNVGRFWHMFGIPVSHLHDGDLISELFLSQNRSLITCSL